MYQDLSIDCLCYSESLARVCKLEVKLSEEAEQPVNANKMTAFSKVEMAAYKIVAEQADAEGIGAEELATMIMATGPGKKALAAKRLNGVVLRSLLEQFADGFGSTRYTFMDGKGGSNSQSRQVGYGIRLCRRYSLDGNLGSMVVATEAVDGPTKLNPGGVIFGFRFYQI